MASCQHLTSAICSLFGGKAGLLSAVIEDSFRSFGQAQADAEPGGLRALGLAYREWALAHPSRYRLMFGGSPIAVNTGVDAECATDALLPLARTLTGRVKPRDFDDFREAMAVWAQVHGAISLEFAAVSPSAFRAEEIYTAILDSILRAYPDR